MTLLLEDKPGHPTVSGCTLPRHYPSREAAAGWGVICAHTVEVSVPDDAASCEDRMYYEHRMDVLLTAESGS